MDELLGNRAAIRRLMGAVERKRTAHAYLLAGPSGVGKRLTALEFARALVCPGEARDMTRHPSVRLLAHVEDKREILIEQVREIQRELSFRALDTKPRILIVDEAERMNEEAQNCLLKTLEEPPDRCIIILISASPALLLPTIVSRCQTILFTPLTDEETVTFARRKLGLDATSAALVALLACGSPGHATALAAEAAELKQRAAELIAGVASGELNAIVERLSKIRDTGQSRERAREQLMLLSFSLREILRHRATGAAPDPVLAPPALVERFKDADVEDVADRIASILDHLKMIDQNANVTLTVEDAMLRI